MRVITNSNVDPLGTGRWAVASVWYGVERTVFVGTLYECCRWAAGI